MAQMSTSQGPYPKTAKRQYMTNSLPTTNPGKQLTCAGQKPNGQNFNNQTS